jgi:tRNA A37 methylthiotransferase MiaB
LDNQVEHTLSVLFEELRDGYYIGKSDNNFNVKVSQKSDINLGDICDIYIVERQKSMLLGEIIKK